MDFESAIDFSSSPMLHIFGVRKVTRHQAGINITEMFFALYCALKSLDFEVRFVAIMHQRHSARKKKKLSFVHLHSFLMIVIRGMKQKSDLSH